MRSVRHSPAGWSRHRPARGSRGSSTPRAVATSGSRKPRRNGSFASRQLTRYTGDIGVEIGTMAWSFDGRALVFERGGEPNPRSLPLGTSARTDLDDCPGRHDAAPDRRRQLAGDGTQREQRCIRRPEFDPSCRVGRQRKTADARSRSRKRRITRVVTRRLAHRVREQPRRSQSGWRVRSRTQIDHLACAERRPGRRSNLVARRQQGRLRPRSGGGARSILIDARRRAVVHLDRRPRDWQGTRSLARPRRLRAADSIRWKGTRRSRGVPTTESSSRGRERAGCTSTASASTGGAPTLLTPGDFEIFSADLSPDRRHVVYSSNQDDLDHRHVWEVPVAGGTPTRLTTGQTIADLPGVRE